MKIPMSRKQLKMLILAFLICILTLPSVKSSDVQLRNNTNAFELWEYTDRNEIKIGTWSSLVQSFLVVFISEIADKTFIIILIFSANNDKYKVFLGSCISMLLMNFLSIVVGYSADMLLYKNMIDWVVFLSLLFYGISLISEAWDISERQEDRYVAIMRDEIGKSKKKELKKYMRESTTENTDEVRLETVVNEQGQEVIPTNIDNRDSLHEPLVAKEDKEARTKEGKLDLVEVTDDENSGKKFIWFFFTSIISAECGDRSQITTIAIASVFNIYGVIIGSSLALILCVFINVYFGEALAKLMKEKHVNYLCGGLLTCIAAEIILIKFGLI